MSTLTPEMQLRIAEWRQKAQQGTLTLEEQREAIKLLRAGRVGAAIASEKSKAKKAKATPRDADALFKELGI